MIFFVKERYAIGLKKPSQFDGLGWSNCVSGLIMRYFNCIKAMYKFFPLLIIP